MIRRNPCIGSLLSQKQPLGHKRGQIGADWPHQTRHSPWFMGVHLACPMSARPSSGSSPFSPWKPIAPSAPRRLSDAWPPGNWENTARLF